jgi:hypothetical protein
MQRGLSLKYLIDTLGIMDNQYEVL